MSCPFSLLRCICHVSFTDVLDHRILPSTLVLVMCALEVVEWAKPV